MTLSDPPARFLRTLVAGSLGLLLASGTTSCSVPADSASEATDTSVTSDTGTGSDTTADGSETGTDTNAYCSDVANPPSTWAQFEAEVLDLVNERRAVATVCGSESYAAADPLTMDDLLQCAARAHAEDMADRGFFDHTNPDGQDPGDRAELAGYEAWAWGENIALGQRSPEEVVEGWMNSPGHCSNIMSPEFTEIGVGYYDGNYWVQVFGRPAE